MPTVRAVICSSERASIGTASSKCSMVTRTMSTVWRSAIRRRQLLRHQRERLGGVADVAAAGCASTRRSSPAPSAPPVARWRAAMPPARRRTAAAPPSTWTASVASRPEYCLTRAAATPAPCPALRAWTSARHANDRLSVIPKSYAIFLAGSSNRRRCGQRRRPGPRSARARPARRRSGTPWRPRSATDGSISPSRASASRTATTTDSASVLK